MHERAMNVPAMYSPSSAQDEEPGRASGQARIGGGLGAIAELFGPKYRNKAESKHSADGTFLRRGQGAENCETKARVSSIVC
jgi:hypothetical protein